MRDSTIPQRSFAYSALACFRMDGMVEVLSKSKERGEVLLHKQKRTAAYAVPFRESYVVYPCNP